MRLIDADALLNRIPNLYERREVSRWVDEAPTVDAVPVVHGRWIRDEFGSRCECCGLYAYRDKAERPWESDYCPYCGTDMRKDGDHHED